MWEAPVSTLLSLTAADALGAATEFKTPQAIAARYGSQITSYQEGSVFGFAPGEATDDSQMTVATLLGYGSVQGGSVQKGTGQGVSGQGVSGVWRALQDWLATGPPDVGGLTRSALRHGSPSGGVLAWQASGYQGAGNGGLMRVAAVWIAGFRGQALARESALITALTHADPRCLYASVFFTAFLDGLSRQHAYRAAATDALRVMEEFDACAALLDAGLLGIDTRDAYGALRERERGARAQVRERVRAGLDGHLISQSGFVLDTLEAAIKHAQAESWQDAVEAAVLLGDDSDTVACVVGAMVGARGLKVPPHLLPPLRLGHTWQGWQRDWPCTEHFPRIVQAAAQGATQA